MPKISNEKKLQVIKDFLTENNIHYTENHKSKLCGITIPLAVKKYKVAIHVGDSDSFYQATRGKYYPIFIRDEDTKAKVLEKIQNTIIKSMTNYQNVLNKRNNGREKGFSKK